MWVTPQTDHDSIFFFRSARLLPLLDGDLLKASEPEPNYQLSWHSFSMAPRFENPTWQVWYLWTDWIIGRLPGLENLRNHQPGVKSRPFCDIVSWGFNRTLPKVTFEMRAKNGSTNNHILPPTTKGSISTIYIHLLSILIFFLALGGWLNDHDL